MGSWLTDIRYAVRRLLTTPGFTMVALVTLALGVGANTAIYSVIDALMLKPLPYRDPSRLTELNTLTREGYSTSNFKLGPWTEWRGPDSVFEALEPYAHRNVTISGARREPQGAASEPQNLIGAAVGGGLMEMLGVPPLAGRLIQPADAIAGRDQVVVLSEDLWRSRYAGDPRIIGQLVQLDDRSYEVIGVMARSFNFPYGRRQFWVPLAIDPASKPPARMSLIGRIRPELTMTEAQTRMDAVSARLVAAKTLADGSKVTLGALIARHLNPPIRRALYVLGGAVALVLLIACANVANLLLVQGAARRREVAVRAALGASRARIVRQLLTETLLLALAGGAAGLIVAGWAVDLLASYAPSEMTFLTVNAIAINTRVLSYATLLTVLTALVFGLLPALRASDGAHDALKQGARTATGSPRQEHLRRAFVLVQLALSLMLLVGAGLLGRTFIRLTQVDPGFDPEKLVAVDVRLPRWKYSSDDAPKRFYADVLDRLRGLPGVAGAMVAGGVPPDGGGISFGLKFEIDGRGVVLDDGRLIMPFSHVDPEYFGLLRIPVRAGRIFTQDDLVASPATVIVINESMARRLWKGDNPVGQRVRFGPKDPWYTVIGVVGDVYQFRHDQPRGQFAVYYPGAERGLGQQTLVARTTGDPAAAIASIKRAIWDLDAELPIQKITSVQAEYREFLSAPRFYAWLMGAFALVGLAIAAIGLYGVIAYATAQRTREFGIRLALGASMRDVLRLVLASGLIVTAAGLALGVAGSMLVARALGSLLIEVPPTDPITYAAVTALLAAIAFVACWIPAHRATRIDPAVTLRYD